MFFGSVATGAAQDRNALSRELPPWVNLGLQVRMRGEGQDTMDFRDGNDQTFLLQRYRVSLSLSPTRWLEFFGQLQDDRSVGIPRPDGNAKDPFDLHQAYVRVGTENGWWDMKVGRQRLAFGSERILGASEWTNTGRVFDAAKLAIHHGADRVDVFSSTVVVNDPRSWDHHQDGSNLHGLYGSVGSILKGSKIEPYVLYRTIAYRGTREWTTGLRMAGTVKQNWTYEADVLQQRGLNLNNQQRAWASTFLAQRLFPSLPWKPSVLGEYSFASGDKHPGDGVSNTFDQLYPTNHGIYGVADQVGRRNMHDLRYGIGVRPEKRLTVRGEAHSFWLASRYDGLYAAGGSQIVAPVVGGFHTSDIGREFDLLADWKLTQHYALGAQYGHLFPGQLLNTYSTGNGRTFWSVWVDFNL